MIIENLDEPCRKERTEQTLPSSFFARPTLDVARDLLGTVLHRRIEGKRVLSGPIVETEAYTQDDPACHAFRGRTKRCEVMFGPAGFSYVYFIYGMYHCLNVVTEEEGIAGAVLIRSVDAHGTNGPGKLCREWMIGPEHNAIDLTDPTGPLWLTRGKLVEDSLIQTTTRIGLSVAAEREWRFIVKDHPNLSAGKPGKRVQRRKQPTDSR
ncbi:MAG: DNA-3-methyladenine glycosylase [Cyanobacteria bacterium]|nr:DNA-3-methyladenine glycosylase [Cyanobacteriota bacterium]